MAKYSSEVKKRALDMMEQEGVTKTCDALKITKATLYKWRSEARGGSKDAAQSQPKAESHRENPSYNTAAIESARALLAEDDDLIQKIQTLETENAKLRERNQKLKTALTALLD